MTPIRLLARRLVRYLRPPNITQYAAQPAVFDAAKRMVALFYVILILLSYLTSEAGFFKLEDPRAFVPLWPLFWTRYVNFTVSAYSIIVFYLASAFIGGLFFHHRWARFIAFLAMLQFHAFISSFGQPVNQLLPWFYAMFLFLFLPDVWGKQATTEEKKKFLLIVWTAQAILLLCYSLSGFWKIETALVQLSRGEFHAFHPNAFALQIAGSWSVMLGPGGIISRTIVNYPWIGWPFMLGAIYLQFFSLWAAIRPSIQKLWSIGIILFHIGSLHIFGIEFFQLVLLNIIFFFFSPFAMKKQSWKKVVVDLPVLGILTRIL